MNVSEALPLPDVYPACTVVPPILSASVGAPVTVTTSEKINVAVTVSPVFSVPLCNPVDEVDRAIMLDTFSLPATSVTVPLAIVAVTVPSKFSNGLTSIVY